MSPGGFEVLIYLISGFNTIFDIIYLNQVLLLPTDTSRFLSVVPGHGDTLGGLEEPRQETPLQQHHPLYSAVWSTMFSSLDQFLVLTE